MSIANNTVNLSEIMTTASDGEGVLGKIVFYGLGGIMIDREEFERLRAVCQFSAPTNFRSTPADAFRSATGDLHDRLVRGTQIYKVYCRDNRQRCHTISRELILEAVDSTTNLYTKLANIVLDIVNGAADTTVREGQQTAVRKPNLGRVAVGQRLPAERLCQKRHGRIQVAAAHQLPAVQSMIFQLIAPEHFAPQGNGLPVQKRLFCVLC